MYKQPEHLSAKQNLQFIYAKKVNCGLTHTILDCVGLYNKI